MNTDRPPRAGPRGRRKAVDPPVILTIRARRWWSEPVRVEPAKRYRFCIDPGQTWDDGCIRGIGADGYDRTWRAPFRRLRRCPEAPWFNLIGEIDRRDPFQVGR